MKLGALLKNPDIRINFGADLILRSHIFSKFGADFKFDATKIIENLAQI